MKTRWEIIFAGSGGQGLGLAGQILGEAAIMETNCFAAHNQSYGARARGGSSQSSLIISRDEIIYPLVTNADLLLALTPEAYQKYEPQVSDLGVIVYDSSSITSPKNRVKEYGYPFQSESLKLGNPKGITILALGTANELLHIVEPNIFLDALGLHFKGKVLDQNKKAFAGGQKLVT